MSNRFVLMLVSVDGTDIQIPCHESILGGSARFSYGLTRRAPKRRSSGCCNIAVTLIGGF
jgi:hypothetical protein